MSERERLIEDALWIARLYGAALLVLAPPPWLAPAPFASVWADEAPEVRALGERVEWRGELEAR